MAVTQRDVKLVYADPPGSVIATPPGTGLNALLSSGFPVFQGTQAPTVDLFLDFNDGTSNATLGISLAGQVTSNGQLPYRKHSWVPTGGFDGGGYIRMTWFTGMGIGFSPVWVTVPGGFTPHYEMKYQVRQSNTMVHPGSSIKLMRQINFDFTYRMGTMEWTNSGVGGGQFQRLKWLYDGFRTDPPFPNAKSNQLFCAWDEINDAGNSCSPKGPGGLTDGNFHEFKIECDFRDPEASLISIAIDGGTVSPSPHQLRPASDSGFILPPVGSTFRISPFAEMYSCGQSGCNQLINSGTYDVDHFSYTILS